MAVLSVEKDRALLITEMGIASGKFNAIKENTTWEKCTLRKWLNHEFITQVFTEEEKKRILYVKVKADRNSEFSTSPGNDTIDQFFCYQSRTQSVIFHPIMKEPQSLPRLHNQKAHSRMMVTMHSGGFGRPAVLCIMRQTPAPTTASITTDTLSAIGKLRFTPLYGFKSIINNHLCKEVSLLQYSDNVFFIQNSSCPAFQRIAGEITLHSCQM